MLQMMHEILLLYFSYQLRHKGKYVFVYVYSCISEDTRRARWIYLIICNQFLLYYSLYNSSSAVVIFTPSIHFVSSRTFHLFIVSLIYSFTFNVVLSLVIKTGGKCGKYTDKLLHYFRNWRSNIFTRFSTRVTKLRYLKI